MLDDRFYDRRFVPLIWVAALITFALVLAWLFYGTAFAQTTDPAVITVGPSPSSTVITFKPLWDGLVPYIAATLGTIMTAAVGWAAYAFNRVTGANLDARAREALHSAAMTGVNLGLQQLGAHVGKLDIATKNSVVRKGVEWVLQAVPEAVRRFGLTPQQVSDIVESKIPTPALVPPAQAAPGVK